MHAETERPVFKDAASLRPRPRGYEAVKAIADFSIALVLSVLLAPVMLAVMLIVKRTSPGPAIYSQERVGRDGRRYTIYKVRSMYHNCEGASGPQWCKVGDDRITPFGRFLRKSHLDELPQLWNVLKGEMSLVGPRPERPVFVKELRRTFPHYEDRLLVRPGVTGLAQVQLPPDTDLESVRRKLVRDVHYVERLDFWLDLRILLVTGLGLVGLPYQVSGWVFALPAFDEPEVAAVPTSIDNDPARRESIDDSRSPEVEGVAQMQPA